MSTYRPRLTEVRHCKHCSNPFETRHKRTLYCTNSCRQLAYQVRNHSEKPKHETNGELTLSANNLGVVAIGSATTALGNYFLNDRPAQQVLLDKLSNIEQGTEQGFNQLIVAAQMTIDFMNAHLQSDPNLAIHMQTVQTKRLAEKQRLKELKQDIKARVLAKHDIKGS